METQKLPNAVISLVLGIVSFIGCCCTSGFGGLVLSGIAFYLAKKDEKTYAENPELYSNFSQIKTAKFIAIIGLILSGIIVCIYIYLRATGQLEELESRYMEVIKEIKRNQ